MVERLKKREKAALEDLYNRYASALFGVVKRILIVDEVAQEVLQDAFLKIWNRMDAYDPEKGRLFTWMLNLSRNLAIDKKRSKEISKNLKTDRLENLVSNMDNSNRLELETDTVGLEETLMQLPEDQRFVVEYLYFKGYTQTELADEFNIPLGTVKTRLRLAMIQLRNIFQVK